MASDASFPRSRRALLAAALGAGAATVASALDRPLPAKAADGDAVILGTTNNATTITGLINEEEGGIGRFVGGVGAGIDVGGIDLGLRATAHGGGGAVGVLGQCAPGVGVQGDSVTGTAGMFGTPKPVGGVHTGIALRAVGRVKFDRCAGVASVTKATTRKVKVAWHLFG